MKTITIKQPWASLIAHGIKDIENRTWKTNFRGRILVHAGKALYRTSIFETLKLEQYSAFRGKIGFSGLDFLEPKGAIIGSVEVVDCVQNHPSIWAEKDCWNWVLANPELFPESIPCKGKLSLWDYPGIPEPEFDEDGHRICMCTMNVKERSQVIRMIDHFECRYCGGWWYK